MVSKPATKRRGEYKCRKWELYLKLRDQQLKTNLYIQRLIYLNLIENANQKTTTDIHTQKKKQPKHTLKRVTKPQENRTEKEGKKKDLQK